MKTQRTLKPVFRSFTRCKRGTSAVEFAITAPLFIFSVVTILDIGIAFSKQMNLDQSVRTGAEFVISGEDDSDRVTELVSVAATGYSQSEALDVGEARPTVTVTEVCRCPGTATEISCGGSCSGSSPARFLSISASENYSPILIPQMILKADIQVQAQ